MLPEIQEEVKKPVKHTLWTSVSLLFIVLALLVSCISGRGSPLGFLLLYSVPPALALLTGLIALIRIKQNNNLKGKGATIFSIIMAIILLCYIAISYFE
jgi:hypothetical protein